MKLNAKMNIDDPFSFVSDMAIATGAGSSGGDYPHYGSYGRTLFGCSYTAVATADGSVTYKGITIPVKTNVQFTISCKNCAWDCNTDGANNTCDPESC